MAWGASLRAPLSVIMPYTSRSVSSIDVAVPQVHGVVDLEHRQGGRHGGVAHPAGLAGGGLATRGDERAERHGEAADAEQLAATQRGGQVGGGVGRLVARHRQPPLVSVTGSGRASFTNSAS